MYADCEEAESRRSVRRRVNGNDVSSLGQQRVTGERNPNSDEAEITEDDCYNYMNRKRNKILDVEDAQAVQVFCIRQKKIDPNFCFEIQMVDGDRGSNFFWADARARSAYQIFGDVVRFDATYKKNKYNMPIAAFFGIDNHMHTIMFGCVLLQDVSEETFIWLFKAWLHVMDDKVPTSFITDQDMAITNAVEKVFPTTRHRLCISPIKEKFPEQLTHINRNNSRFREELNKCIQDSVSIDDFERSWNRLVMDYNLTENHWFRKSFEMRAKWVPIFCKDMFCGGMKTAGRSQRIKAIFDTFVNSGTTWKEFVCKYNQALENWYEKSRKAEFNSRHKNPVLRLGMGLEEHAGNIYTFEIFKLFHAELTNMLSCRRETLVKGDHINTYRVSNRLSEDVGMIVEYNKSTLDSKCECMLFECQGILCRHILSVLHMHSVDRIPAQYIMNRWTKDVARVIWRLPVAIDKGLTSSIQRFQIKAKFDDIYKICERSNDAFEYVKKGIYELHASAKALLDGDDFVGSSSPPQHRESSAQQSSYNIQDPNVTQTKGMIETV